MNPETTIWLVLDSRANGGIETHVLELARGLRQGRWRVTVVFIEDHGPHPLRSALQGEGIATFCLDGGFGSLMRRLRSQRPALIHSHGYKAGLYCSAASSLLGCTHVSTFHAGEFGSGRVALYDWLHRQSSRFNAANFAVSSEIATRVPGQPLVLNNFISLPELAGESGDRLAFVGRLSEEKGPDRLVEIAGRSPATRFDFYGDGPLLSSLKAAAGENCRFHGNQADMTPHWRNIALLLMPSRHEGLPMAALEAMARRIPVIAFDVGGLHRLIDNGENGWLIESGDVDGFRRAIADWLALDEARRDAIRDSARRRIVEQFSSQRIVPMVLEHYRRALGKAFPACDAFCE